MDYKLLAKMKIITVHAMKAYREAEVQLHPFLTSAQEIWHPMKRRLDSPCSQSGHFGEEKSLLFLRRTTSVTV